MGVCRLRLGVMLVVLSLCLLGTELPAAADCYLPAVDGTMTAPFEEPPCQWCAGDRGIEYATVPGDPAVAMAAGTVTFAGEVAGTLYVTIRHADDRRTTVGRLRAVLVRVDQRVASGQVIGIVGESTIVTVRLGDAYLDPAPLIGRQTWHPRLVPVDGSARRPAVPASLRCPSDPGLREGPTTDLVGVRRVGMMNAVG